MSIRFSTEINTHCVLDRSSVHDVTSSLIADSEAIYVHAGSRQLLVHLTEDVLGQRPSTSQDPGEVDVEKAQVVEAGVHQRVRLVVRGKDPVGSIRHTWIQMV